MAKQHQYTTVFLQVLQRAKDIAKERKHQFVEPEHVLKSELSEKIDDDTIVWDTLNRANVDFDKLNSELDNELSQISSVKGSSDTKIQYGNINNKDLATFIKETNNQANILGDDYVAPDEIILAALHDKNLAFTKFMQKEFKINYEIFKDYLLKVRDGETVTAANSVRGKSILDKYGIEMVAQAKKGKMDPIIGRESETRKMIQILLRKNKNNPLLIANPGVGKTALVEGLAQKIAKNDIPDELKGVKLYNLDLTSLTAGASVRGAFEGRIEAVLKEVEKSHGKIILFIDEIHNVMGAGGAKGRGDASQILKPALARGQLHLIGATTIVEFKKFIEPDAALTRRFAQVRLAEPSEKEAIDILRGLRPRFESFYGVTFHDDALVEAVKMSERYIAERYLPDKAIELIDSAGSKIKLDTTSTPPSLDNDQKDLFTTNAAINSLRREYSSKDSKELTALLKKKDELVNRIKVESENWDQAKIVLKSIKDMRSKMHTILNKINSLAPESAQVQEMNKQVDSFKQKIHESVHDLNGFPDSVTASIIDEVVSEMTGINVKSLQEGEKAKLLRLPKILHQRVIGQDDAVDDVADAIKRSRTGLSAGNRPIGSFFFVGPTGVGKTELAKTISAVLFDDEKALIRIDMSEYQSKASITRLIGSPPGYVGYEEAGQLTEKVRLHPYSVVLFDEVEKAHPDVLNLLLQVLDDGRLTDGKGRTIDFTNTICILTSNLGSDKIISTWKDLDKPVNATTKSVVRSSLLHFFRPEFLNRLDFTVIFKPLSLKDQSGIAKIQLERLKKRMYENDNLKLEVSPKALQFVTVQSYNKDMGARPLRRFIQNFVEKIIADAILNDKFKEGDTVHIIRQSGLDGYGNRIHRLAIEDQDHHEDNDQTIQRNPDYDMESTI